ncbi:hypothetical protein [Microseira sp. BLCC-F43]
MTVFMKGAENNASPFQSFLSELYFKYKSLPDGKVAGYIVG